MRIRNEATSVARALDDALHAQVGGHGFPEKDRACQQIPKMAGSRPGRFLRFDGSADRAGRAGSYDAKSAVVGDGAEYGIGGLAHPPNLMPESAFCKGRRGNRRVPRYT